MSGHQLCHWCCGGSTPWGGEDSSSRPVSLVFPLPPACHHHPQTALSFGFLRLWTSGFSPFLILAASLLPVPLPLRGSLGTHAALGPPAPWVAQPFLAPQLETGDCQKHSPRLPCLSPRPQARVPPAEGLVPGPHPLSRACRLPLSPGAFLAASVAQIRMPWIPRGLVLPAGWREAAGARSQEAAFARGASAAAAPEPSPRSPAAAKIHRVVLSFLTLVRKKGARSVLIWGGWLAAPKDRLCVCWEVLLAHGGLPPAAVEVLPGRGDRNTKNETCLALYYHLFCPAQNWCDLLNPCKTFAATSLLHLLTYHVFGGLFSLLLWVGPVQRQREGEVRPNICLSKDEAKRWEEKRDTT